MGENFYYFMQTILLLLFFSLVIKCISRKLGNIRLYL